MLNFIKLASARFGISERVLNKVVIRCIERGWHVSTEFAVLNFCTAEDFDAEMDNLRKWWSWYKDRTDDDKIHRPIRKKKRLLA